MAIICDAVLWPLLRAIKPTADKHTLDVLPTVWPKAIAFFKAAAAAPASVVDGSLRLDLGGAAARTHRHHGLAGDAGRACAHGHGAHPRQGQG